MASIDKSMIVTTPEIPGYKAVKSLGFIQACSKKSYSQERYLMAVSDAMLIITEMAQNMGANAIVGFHSQILPMFNDYVMVQVCMYGTAVVVEKI